MGSFIKAHIFTTPESAETAIETINTGEGIPVNESAITRTYTDFQEQNGIYYILSDKVTQKYLGQPEDLEIKEIEI